MSSVTIDKSPEDTNQRKELWWKISVSFLFFTGVVLAVSRTRADPDLWGHLRFGLDTLSNQGVVQIDPYSYLTAGQRWFNHEWLAEVSYALVWYLAGSSGLILLKTATWLATYGLLFWYLVRLPLPPLRTAILLGLSIPLMAPIFGPVRPHMYTALLFTVLLLIIIKADKGSYGWLWGAPVIFVLWPNLHGAFLIGLGVLGLWGLIHFLTHRQKRVLFRVLPPILASIIATLVNPYGIDLWIFLANHIRDPRQEITEWRPIAVNSTLGLIYLFWIILCALGLKYTRRQRSPALVVVFAVLAFLPLVSERHLLFFAIGTVMLMGPHIVDAWDRVMPVPTASRSIKPIAIIIPVLAALIIIAIKPPDFSRIPLSKRFPVPAGSISFLNESGVSGNLAVHFDWGDYAIWHLTPEIKVSIDTRREMAYAQEIYHTNLRFMTGSGDWADLIDQHPTEMALVKKNSASDNLMKLRSDWDLVYEDELSGLYVKQGVFAHNQFASSPNGYQTPENMGYFP